VRILIVCTANVCRSVVGERLLARHLAGAGVPAVVTSAGTGVGPGTVDRVHRHTRAAVEPYGIDVSGHRPRALDGDVLRDDGADLVVTMTREHLYTVVGLDPGAFSRTFTLTELARRAAGVSPQRSFVDWVGAVAEGRLPSNLLPGTDLDDIADPYGMSRRAHVAMVVEVDDLMRTVAASIGGASASGHR
jgi:protein-tyrosine phosphatase